MRLISAVNTGNLSYLFIQACVAILILVGFESVTSLGDEAKNAKRDIPRAVLLSLFIQGVVCYLFEYFAAGYFLNPGYPITTAAGSGAPLADMMKLAGTWLFGSANGCQHFHVDPGSHGVSGAHRDHPVLHEHRRSSHLCHGTRRRSAFTFRHVARQELDPASRYLDAGIVSVVIGIITVLWYLCGPSATAALDTSLSDAQKVSFWYPKFLVFSNDTAGSIPNSLIIVTLCSNFGTFMLYMITCYIAMVAFREHHTFSGFKHMFVPIFGDPGQSGVHVVLPRRAVLCGGDES